MNRASSPEQALAPVSRRRVLRWALYGGAAVMVGAGAAFSLLRRSPRDQMAVPESLEALSASEYHLFERATAVLLPLASTPLTPLSAVPVIAHIDAMMALLPAGLRQDVTAGLALFDHAALVSGWHGKRFVDLGDAEALAYFDAWSRGNSIQRALATLVKKFVYVAYWRDPATWPPIEFDGPVSDRWGLVSLGNAPLPSGEASS